MSSQATHTGPLSDQVVQARVEIVAHQEVAEATRRMRLHCPQLAERIRPGQFFMVRLPETADPLIGRPFAMYDVVRGAAGQAECVDFVYLVAGNLTRQLAHLPAGQMLDVWGPLGNGFVPAACRHLVMVAGGIGQTPFLAVARERLRQARYGRPVREVPPVDRITLIYGARSARRLACVEDFEQTGIDVRLATEDGSRGHHGRVTDLLQACLSGNSPAGLHLLCCGPHAMLAAVSRLAAQHGVSCEVSLEEPMACGIGICFTCVARVRDADGHWDYRRTCVDGPVFPAERIAW